MPPRHPDMRRTGSYRRLQSGSMAVNMMLMLIGLIGMLGLVEAGYLYWAKRDTQKVADLSSLAGAQQLQDCNAGNTSNSAALGNATKENGFSSTLAITCGTWDPVANAGVTDYFSTVASGVSPNAVKVVATRPMTPPFGFISSLPTISTEAVATNAPPVAAFSVGTTLVDISGAAPLQQFLQSIGINISGTSLVGYSGLANVTITPAGLLQQLGISVPSNITVGQLNTLLSANTNVQTLINVLNAVVTVGGQQALTNANISLVSAIDAAVGNIPLNVVLGSASNAPSGLFAEIVGPDGAAQSALNTQVNALQLLNAAIGVATTQHAISASSINLNLPFGITFNAATSVIEPPSIGIGGVGTTAYTAQIRTFIDISNTSSSSLLLGPNGLIDLYINLPIAIDLVNAQATLTSLCSTTSSAGAPEANISVESSVLKMCVGNITQAGAFSTALGCDQIPGATTPQKLFALSAAGLNLASLTTSIDTNALTGNGSVTLTAGSTGVTSDALNIGTSVNNLVTALTAALLTNSGTSPPSSSSQTATQTATDLWNNTTTTNSNAQRLQQALGEVQTASQGFQGLLGNITGTVTDLLGNTVQLNVTGLLSDVGSLLNGVTGVLSGLLNDVGCTVLNQSASCISVIAQAMSGGGTGANSNAFVSLLGFLLQALQQPLNDVGSQALTPTLNALGIEFGQNTVDLQSLECHRVQLVY